MALASAQAIRIEPAPSPPPPPSPSHQHAHPLVTLPPPCRPASIRHDVARTRDISTAPHRYHPLRRQHRLPPHPPDHHRRRPAQPAVPLHSHRPRYP
eukprot:3485417-Rhodomonas_salina.1